VFGRRKNTPGRRIGGIHTFVTVNVTSDLHPPHDQTDSAKSAFVSLHAREARAADCDQDLSGGLALPMFEADITANLTIVVAV